MKKIIKVILWIVLFVMIVVMALSIYVGNYLYDYTINPHSSVSIFERLDIDESKSKEAIKWLDENTIELNQVSYDGLKLHSYYVSQGCDVTIILVHGYMSQGTSVINQVKRFYEEGYNMLIPDLRGHGKSDGTYIGMGLDDRKDIMMWIDYLVDNGHSKIALYGISMGGATVLNVSGEELPLQVKAIISDCAYSSVVELLKYHLDLGDIKNRVALSLASFMTYIRAGYRIEDVVPINKVKNSKVPILYIHGQKDEFIPVSMAYDLYNQTLSKKSLLILSEGVHAYNFKYSDVYYECVFDFINTYNKYNRDVDEFTKIYQ